MKATVIVGDALETLRGFDADAVDAIVTSPPYWKIIDYGVASQLGGEELLQDYCVRLEETLRECFRVCRGAMWWNVADAYATWHMGTRRAEGKYQRAIHIGRTALRKSGLKPGDMICLPDRIKLMMQRLGYVRADVTWRKPNAAQVGSPQPDRPVRDVERLLLCSRERKYFFDLNACPPGSVWDVQTAPYFGSHPCPMPGELATILVRSVTRPGGLVLDPFAGSCRTGVAALATGRRFLGVELSPGLAEEGRGNLADPARSYREHPPSDPRQPPLFRGLSGGAKR